MQAFRWFPVRTALLSGVLILVSSPAVQAWPKILPYHFGRYPVPPRYYGYPLDDQSAGYYGGMRYREYYSFNRGYFLANFPDSVPNYQGRWLAHRKWPYPEWESPRLIKDRTPPECACITVNVPPNADVWLEDHQSQQSGAVRTFVSPPLASDQKFVYKVRARWRAGNEVKVQVRDVVVHSGQRVNVQFNAAEQLEVMPSAPSLQTPPANVVGPQR